MNKECEYCNEKENKIKKYKEEIEKEKARECLKALEREKIAKGMQCTKSDEIKLREIQKMQMIEKKRIEQSQADIDELWHKVLLDDVRMKEHKEKLRAERLKQEMLERRLAYDEQIASANRTRRETLQSEREIENKRLEKMKKKMEQDYYNTIKRKTDQQVTNKKNFIEGYEMKLSKLRMEKIAERNMDINAIQVAFEELRRERQKKMEQIQSLKLEKQLFIENYNRERKMANELELEAERITNEWKKQAEKGSDDAYKNTETQKFNNKLKATQEYKRYLGERNSQLEKKRQERIETMERVKRTAYAELRNNLDSANEEMRRQIQYRQGLSNQIRNNNRVMEMELNGIKEKQRAFTKKAIMFKDAMRDKVGHSFSENPVHPFKRTMQNQEKNNTLSLPLI